MCTYEAPPRRNVIKSDRDRKSHSVRLDDVPVSMPIVTDDSSIKLNR